jgi:putative transposase
MPFGRPRRLDAFDYAGFYRYHVRIATWNRARHFTDREVAGMARERLLTFAATYDLAVNAYCFMPDHVHLLLAGRCPDARLRMFVGAWKQNTGYAFTRMRTGARLWQPSYFERVLREVEGNETVARYILENPVRAGLVGRVGEYPYAWCAWALGDLQG